MKKIFCLILVLFMCGTPVLHADVRADNTNGLPELSEVDGTDVLYVVNDPLSGVPTSRKATKATLFTDAVFPGDLTVAGNAKINTSRVVDGSFPLSIRIANPTVDEETTLFYVDSTHYPSGIELIGQTISRDLTMASDLTVNASYGTWSEGGYTSAATINQITLTSSDFTATDSSLTTTTVPAGSVISINTGKSAIGGYNVNLEGYKK